MEMTSLLRRTWNAGLNRSPAENARALRSKLRRNRSKIFSEEVNVILPSLQRQPILADLAASRLSESSQVVGLLGDASDTSPYRVALEKIGIKSIEIEWAWQLEWGSSPDPTDQIDVLVVCKVPQNPQQWQVLRRLKEMAPPKVVGIQELLLPFAPLQLAQSLLPYYEETSTLSSIAPYYLGREYFGPIGELNEAFPLAGKSVIEFGPMDGCQTAGLVSAGVGRLVSVEARAENFMKTLVASQSFDWKNVELVMDDFHNADQTTYGRFDLVFAHGVYYHSFAPFHFFRNMLSLADHVFIGGFCATESLPSGPFSTLKDENQEYKVKKHQESTRSMTGGINPVGYYFEKNDLMRFFHNEGYETTVISDEASEAPSPAGRYLRFLSHPKRLP